MYPPSPPAKASVGDTVSFGGVQYALAHQSGDDTLLQIAWSPCSSPNGAPVAQVVIGCAMASSPGHAATCNGGWPQTKFCGGEGTGAAKCPASWSVTLLSPLAGLNVTFSVQFFHDASIHGSPMVWTQPAVVTARPGSPTSVVATTGVNASGAFVAVTWDPPHDDGGSPIMHYVVTMCRSSDCGGSTVYGRNITFAGLAADVGFTFSIGVQAANLAELSSPQTVTATYSPHTRLLGNGTWRVRTCVAPALVAPQHVTPDTTRGLC